MQKKIYTIGDSHSSNVHSHWGKIQIPNVELEIICNRIGPCLAYTLGSGKIDHLVLPILKKIKNEDIAVFCFGEIDCRCHVGKQIRLNKTYQEVINEIVSLYLSKISELTQHISEVYVYNVTPPLNCPSNEAFTEEFPHVGTAEERRRYYLYMNDVIKDSCEKFKLKFFDIYDNLIDSLGYLDSGQSDEGVHVIDPTAAQNFISNIFHNSL